jgi:hypothetical protein
MGRENGGYFAFAFASLRRPLSTCFGSLLASGGAVSPRTYILHWAGALVHMAGRHLLTFCRRHVNNDAEKHTSTVI